MSVYRKFVLEAKSPAKFVPSSKKIQEHKKELQSLQNQMRRVTKSLGTINQSKSTPPKLKTARIQKEKALINYLRSSIMYKQLEIRQIQHPE